MRAVIEVGVLHTSATLNGEVLGTKFSDEQAARRAVLRAMRDRHGLIPRDGDEAYLNPQREDPMSTIAAHTVALAPERQTKYNGRAVEMRWPVREDPQENGDVRHIFAELTVHHHGRAEIAGRPDRCFTVTLGRAYITKRAGGMTSQTFGVGRGLPSVRVLPSEPCARFSAKRIEELADRALVALREMADDPNVQAIFDPALGWDAG